MTDFPIPFQDIEEDAFVVDSVHEISTNENVHTYKECSARTRPPQNVCFACPTFSPLMHSKYFVSVQLIVLDQDQLFVFFRRSNGEDVEDFVPLGNAGGRCYGNRTSTRKRSIGRECGGVVVLVMVAVDWSMNISHSHSYFRVPRLGLSSRPFSLPPPFLSLCSLSVPVFVSPSF